jgi:succinyl-diaminopimelate desuccinylase
VGGIHATLIFEGKSAHSARPWQGENAIHKAGDLLQDLHRLEAVEVNCDSLLFREVMSVTLAQGGSARNVVPGKFELNLNYRYAPGKNEEEARQNIIDFVAGRCRVVWKEQIPAGRVCLDNSFLKKWRQHEDLDLQAKQAWTDVAQLSAFGVDAVNFGPGHAALAHREGEYVDATALEKNLCLLRELLKLS